MSECGVALKERAANLPGRRVVSAPPQMRSSVQTYGLEDEIDSTSRDGASPVDSPATPVGGAQRMLGSPFVTPIRQDTVLTHGPFSPDETLAEAQERIRVLEYCCVGLQGQVEQMQYQLQEQGSRLTVIEQQVPSLAATLSNVVWQVGNYMANVWSPSFNSA